MKVLDLWETWVAIYLISAVIFAQMFKISNRHMKNAGALTILLELFTALFAIFFLPFFHFSLPSDKNVYFTLLIVTILYAITDRLNIEARYGLPPSTFSMLKQLSTVFMIFFGFFLLKEPLLITKVLGSIVIVFANVILTFESGKFQINKYFIMSLVSNFLFAVAMLINVNISDNFNLAFYTILTVSVPALLIFIFGHHTLRELKNEFSISNKKVSAICVFSSTSRKSILASSFAIYSIIKATG